MVKTAEREFALNEFIALGKRRNEAIPQWIKNGQIYMPGERLKTLVTMSIFWLYVSGLDVEGVNYLNEAQSLVRAGKRLMITSNHHSDSDHTAKRYVFREIGYGELADRLFFLGGFKMLEREETRRFMPAENVVLIPTPADIHNLSYALKLRHEKLLTPEQEAVVKGLLGNYQKVKKTAVNHIERLMDSGMVLAFYPEATRSRNELLLGRAPQEVETYFDKERELYVLPMMTKGTAKIMNLEDQFQTDRTRVRMIIGKPYPAREIWGVDLSGNTLKGTPATRADAAMARMAVLMPELVNPVDLVAYQQLCVGYDPRARGVKYYHSDSFLDIFEGTPLEAMTKNLIRNTVALGKGRWN